MADRIIPLPGAATQVVAQAPRTRLPKDVPTISPNSSLRYRLQTRMYEAQKRAELAAFNAGLQHYADPHLAQTLADLVEVHNQEGFRSFLFIAETGAGERLVGTKGRFKDIEEARRALTRVLWDLTEKE